MNDIVMKKQIIYAPLIPRIFAMTIDSVILSLVLTPIMFFISYNIFLHLFSDFFITYGVNTADKDAIAVALKMPEFATYFSPTRFFTYYCIPFLLNSFFLGAYFIFFWSKFGATPGKMLMRLKIVDANDFTTPTTRKLVKRFFGYITALFGIWTIIFSRRKMAVHDMIANTVVIKS